MISSAIGWELFWTGQDVFYGTVTGFKGLERRVVVLAIDGFGDEGRARELLYTGMTRARDLLILAMAESDKTRPWLETVAPDCLLPESAETTTLTLANGETLGYEQWNLAAPEDAPDPENTKSAANPLYWFVTPDQPSRQPLNFSASITTM